MPVPCSNSSLDCPNNLICTVSKLPGHLSQYVAQGYSLPGVSQHHHPSPHSLQHCSPVGRAGLSSSSRSPETPQRAPQTKKSIALPLRQSNFYVLYFVLFEIQSPCIIQTGLKVLMVIPWPQPPECWFYSMHHHVQMLSCFYTLV